MVLNRVKKESLQFMFIKNMYRKDEGLELGYQDVFWKHKVYQNLRRIRECKTCWRDWCIIQCVLVKWRLWWMATVVHATESDFLRIRCGVWNVHWVWDEEITDRCITLKRMVVKEKEGIMRWHRHVEILYVMRMNKSELEWVSHSKDRRREKVS